MKIKPQSLLFLFVLALFAGCVPAAYAEGEIVGLGGVADNLTFTVDMVADFVKTASALLGGLFLFSAIVKYVEYRRNPLVVQISTVIFLLIAGLLLIALSFLSHYSSIGTS